MVRPSKEVVLGRLFLKGALEQKSILREGRGRRDNKKSDPSSLGQRDYKDEARHERSQSRAVPLFS